MTVIHEGLWEQGVKAIPVAILSERLAQLPSNSFVCVNKVGNLGIYSPEGTFIGYVDFMEGEIELNESEESGGD